MRFVAAIVLALLALAALGYSAFVNVPRVRVLTYMVSKPVWETRTKTVTKTVDVNGKKVNVSFDVTDSVMNFTEEQRERTIMPQLWEYLHFGFVASLWLIFF